MGSRRIVIGYADGSFIVSLDATDANSAAAADTLSVSKMPLAWTDWHSLEVGNAVRLREFRGLGTASETAAILATIQRDLASGILSHTVVDLARAVFCARTLSEKHSAAFGTRSLDILHVAIALEMQATEFFTFDARQAKLWRAESSRPALPRSSLTTP